MVFPSSDKNNKHLFFRWLAVFLLPTLFILIFAWLGGIFTPNRLTAEKFMTALHEAGNPGLGSRRAHAKGLCVIGYFDATGAVSPYSKSSLFHENHVSLIGRFALSPGTPIIADNPQEVRSLALRFLPKEGGEWRTAMNDPPLQPMRDAQDAYDFFQSLALDPKTHKPDPLKLKKFAETHPWLKTALETDAHRPISSGFADDIYHSLDSFLLINQEGKITPTRWSLEPVPPLHISANPEKNPNGLFTDLITTLSHKPLQWHMIMILANPNDPVNDPSQAWNKNDQKIIAGTITITKAISEEEGPCTNISFDPTILPEGMALSGDPLPALRSSLYMRSFQHRSAEKKIPAMVSPQIVQQAEQEGKKQ